MSTSKKPKTLTMIKTEMKQSNIVLNPKQTEYFKTIKDSTLTICHGPAGTSKTFVFCYSALQLLLNGDIDRIILTKPIKESGENLGFLPGTVEEKIEPFIMSYLTNFYKIIGEGNTKLLMAEKKIIAEPLAYMRGSTYDNALMALDEAQNSSLSQLMLWITRIGKDTKAVMMGDTSQYDIREKDAKFSDFIKMVRGVTDVSMFEFNKEDIVRNKFLIEIVDRYEKYRSEHRD